MHFDTPSKYEEYLCNDEILGKEQAKKCQQIFNGKATCLKKHECNDKWKIRPDNKEEINLLSLFIDDINISLSRNYIEEKQINYDKLITVITDITKKYGIKNRTGYSFKDMNRPIKEVIDEFYEICSCIQNLKTTKNNQKYSSVSLYLSEYSKN